MKTLDALLSELRQRGVTLWLEGDRLRYRVPEGRMTPDLMVDLKAHKNEILDFLRQVSTASHTHRPPLVPVVRNGTAPLSFAQKRFWLLHQFEPNSSANNMPVVLHLTGKLDVSALEKSLIELARRHEILRTTFPLVDGEPRQAIAPHLQISIPLSDLRQIPTEKRDAEAFRLATEVARCPFDLLTGPMLHVQLLRLKDDEYLFVWCLHCITGDGSSSDIFYQELTTLYAAFSAGQPSPLPELSIQYADFAQWQREWLQGEVLETQLKYWQRQLSGPLQPLPLPADRPRPPVQTYRGDRCPRMFSKRLHGDLMKLAQQSGTTLFMILLAAFETLLYRYSGQEDLLISFTNAGRNQIETEKLIGFFSGTLLLRTNFAGNPTFRALLNQVKDDALDAYAHQDLPFEKLIEELRPEQTHARSPLFQIKFALNPPWTNGRGMSAVKLPNLQIDSLFGYIYHGQTKFDLILVMREQEQGLGAVFDYNADLFDAATANRMMNHFEILLEGIVANPDRQISDLPLLEPEERQQLLEAWNQTQADYPEICIHQLFEGQAAHTPEAITLRVGAQQFTYGELNQRANQLAFYLHTLGVQPETPVGICLEEMVPETWVAILGVLKAGGAYVLLDPNDPADRITFILGDAQVPVLLTQQTLVKQVPLAPIQIVCLDRDWDVIAQHPTCNLLSIATPDNVACILYPPDSSEQPRGVQILHQGVVNLLAAMAQTLGLSQEDVVLVAETSFSDGLAILDLFLSLSVGAVMAVVSRQIVANGEELAQTIQTSGATVMQTNPSTWHRLITAGWQGSQALKILCGGKPLSPELAQELAKRAKSVWSLYGFPETTLLSMCHNIKLTEAKVLIGKPIANTQIYLLDAHKQPVPIGVVGKLYIGGAGVARGYLNHPKMTAERFLHNPFSRNPGARMYDTDNLARFLPDGTLEALSVTPEESGDCLSNPSHSEFRQPTISFRDDVERQLAAIWETVFDTQPIGVQDNFFEIGGHSLLAVRLFAQIEKAFHKNLPLSSLLQSPTIAQLAELLREDAEPVPWSPLVLIQAGNPSTPPLFCIHGGGFNVLVYRHLAANMGPEQTVYGLQARELDGRTPIRDRLEDIAADYIQQIQTIQPEGPYLLSGLSNGGNIALEIAQQLQIQGQNVSLLAMFDTYGLGGAKLLPPVPRLLSSLSYMARYGLLRLMTNIQENGSTALLTKVQTQLNELGKVATHQTQQPEERPSMPQSSPVVTSRVSSLLRQLEQRMNQISLYILEHSPWAFFTPTAQLLEVDGSMPDTLKQLEESYQKVHKAYNPKAYQGRILLFRAKELPPGYKIDPYLGWGAIATEGVEVHRVPGHHTSLIESHVLAEKLGHCIKAAIQKESRTSHREMKDSNG